MCVGDHDDGFSGDINFLKRRIESNFFACLCAINEEETTDKNKQQHQVIM